MIVSNQTEVAAQKPKYVWAIKSTMDPNVRKPVLFDTFNDDCPNDYEVARDIRRMYSGESFDNAILPKEGWFVARPPKRIPSMFIANGFFVVDEEVKAVFEKMLRDDVTLSPFELREKRGGSKVGDFFVVVFRKVHIGIDPEEEVAGTRKGQTNKISAIRATAKDDEIVVASASAQNDLVWIEKWIRSSIFFSEEAYAALRAHLKKSRFGMVRCKVDRDVHSGSKERSQ